MRRRAARLPNRKLVVLDDPFAESDPEPLVLVPAINPDVTVIHAQRADTQGMVRIAGLTFADVEQARAAEQFAAYLDEYLYGVDGHAEYLEKIGAEALECIRAVAPFGYAPGLARR